MSQQLVKKGANGRYSNVMPKSWIEAIKDKNTGQTLVEILQGFNMYFLSYTGDVAETRKQVPAIIRKKGLWITYVKYDGNVYTEWYAADEIDDKSWGDSSNWRVGNNTLVGDITISANGNWVINGTETEFKAVGEKGNTPLIRVANNRLQVSYDLGDTYIDVTNNPVYTKFRWLATTGDTQANNVGRLQASTDEGKTWTNMSNDFTNNLHISRYIGVSESLPTSGIAEGTIYAKGPYYDEGDTSNSNPIYRLWVYAWKGNTLAWQDNGEFTSIAAGVVQEIGDSETEVMSQKAVTEKLSELGSKVFTEIPLTIKEQGKAIDEFGNVVEANTFTIYNPVELSNGTRLRIDSRGWNLSVLSRLNNDGSYTPVVAFDDTPHEGIRNTFYTIEHDGKYVFCSSSIDGYKEGLYITTSDMAIQEIEKLKNKIEKNEEEKRALASRKINLCVKELNKAITLDGEVVAANNFTIYQPIYIKSGTIVRILSNGYNMSAFSKVNEDGTYTPIISYIERIRDINEAFYITETDGLYIFSSGRYVDFSGELYISDNEYKTKFTPSVGETYKAVIPDGSVVSTSPYYYISRPFMLKKNTAIKVVCGGDVISALSKVNEDGSYISIVDIPKSDSNSVKEFGYIAKETGLYVITSNTTKAVVYSDKEILQPFETEISMVGGDMLESLGVQVHTTSPDRIFKNFITENYIEFDGRTDELLKIHIDSNESALLHGYDSSFNFIGRISIYSIPEEVRYIKILISSSNSYNYRLKNLKVYVCNRKGFLSYVKNDISDAKGEKGVTPYWISYEIVKPTIDTTENADYNGNNSVRCWNNGYVMLPPNYERDGKPVPLIIVGHGTNCYSFGQNTIYWYGDLISFLARNGYAVADCSTTSSLYPNQKDANCPTPLAMACYKGLYECVCNRFNVDKENVFMFGHSAGGMLTSIFSFTKPFPLKAVASMAGSLELITNMRILTPYTDHTFFLSQLGIDTTNYPQIDNSMFSPNSEAKEFYLNNADKLIGYNPFTIGSVGIDNYQLCKVALEAPFPYGAESYQPLKDITSSAFKILPVPMKIWHAVDDDKVPFSMSRFYQQIVQNAGGRCEVRPLPEGTGKHGSVDVAENAPRTNYMTKCGIEMNVSVAYAEMVDWFNSFLG